MFPFRDDASTGLFQVYSLPQFSSVQPLSHVRLFATPWTEAHQASLSITNSQSLLKLMSIESVMPSHHLILCRPLLLLPSIFPSIRVFSNESVLHIRWWKYWSFSFSISPSPEAINTFSHTAFWFTRSRTFICLKMMCVCILEYKFNFMYLKFFSVFLEAIYFLHWIKV